MSNSDAVIRALRTGHTGLAERLSTLSDEDLVRQSGAARWDVSEVLSHLGSGSDIARATLQAALDAKPAPGQEFMATVWDRWNAMTPRQRAEAFLDAHDGVTRLYESLDAGTRENVRVDVGFLPAPVDVATAARLRLSELALHSWDVHVSFDDHAVLAPDATAQLLHGAPDLTGWISKPEALGGESAVIRVVTDSPTSDFTLRLGSSVSIDLDVPEQPDGTLTLPAEAWLRLVAGRLATGHTPDEVRATGAADLDVLRRVFPGY